MTDTTVSAYLNVPPPVSSPRLINEALKTFSIVLEQALGIPNEMWLKKGVAKEVHRPLPKRAEVHVKLEILLLVRNGDNIFFKLFNM